MSRSKLPGDARPTTVRVSNQDVLIIELITGLSFSEFVRACTDGALATDDELCPECGQVVNSRKIQAMRIGREVLKTKKEQQKIVEPEPEIPEEKIRVWDKGQESYAMIAMSEIALHPEWYTIDETTAPYGVDL
jgi:hypothetical protein